MNHIVVKVLVMVMVMMIAGYGTELVRSSTRYFHDVLHKNDIIAEIKDDNPPSLKLMKHCVRCISFNLMCRVIKR